MKIAIRWAALAALGALAACNTAAKPDLISQAQIESAQADIGEQLASYLAATRRVRIKEAADRAVTSANPTWCGSGKIDYDITSVKVDLQTTLDNTVSGSFEAKPPLGAGVTADIKAGASKEETNSQELSYTIYPLPEYYQPREIGQMADAKSPPSLRPIAQVLMNQRKALINSARRDLHPDAQACMADFNPAKPTDANGQLIIGLKAIEDKSGGITFSLAVVSLGASFDAKKTNGNTLTVNFQQSGLSADSVIAPCDDDIKAPCVFTPLPTPVAVPKKEESQKGLVTPASLRREGDGSVRLLRTAFVGQRPSPPASEVPPPASSPFKLSPDGTTCLQQQQGVWVPVDCPGTLPKPTTAPRQCKKSGGLGILKVPNGSSKGGADGSGETTTCPTPAPVTK